MSTAAGQPDAPSGPHVPAYGPIEALLGLGMTYLVVDHVTPAVVNVAGTLLPDLPAATARTALAAFLWFVVLVTVLDQARRQLAAFGIGSHHEVVREARGPGLLSRELALGYVVLLVLGGLVAGYAFDAALATLTSLIRVVSSQDLAAFDLGRFVLMVAFFVAYGLATRAFDRLLIGGLRLALAE